MSAPINLHQSHATQGYIPEIELMNYFRECISHNEQYSHNQANGITWTVQSIEDIMENVPLAPQYLRSTIELLIRQGCLIKKEVNGVTFYAIPQRATLDEKLQPKRPIPVNTLEPFTEE